MLIPAVRGRQRYFACQLHQNHMGNERDSSQKGRYRPGKKTRWPLQIYNVICTHKNVQPNWQSKKCKIKKVECFSLIELTNNRGMITLNDGGK